MKALDIFGNKLYTGDVVVFADAESGEPTLSVYEIEEIVDNNVVYATCMNGDAIDCRFYLQGTDTRCSYIRNVYKTAEAKQDTTIN